MGLLIGWQCRFGGVGSFWLAATLARDFGLLLQGLGLGGVLVRFGLNSVVV